MLKDDFVPYVARDAHLKAPEEREAENHPLCLLRKLKLFQGAFSRLRCSMITSCVVFLAEYPHVDLPVPLRACSHLWTHVHIFFIPLLCF